MATHSDVPDWSYGSNPGEWDAYAEDEFAAELEAYLLDSPSEAVELPVDDLLGHCTTSIVVVSEASDELEGSINNIFQNPNAVDNGVDDIFANSAQSSDHVDEVQKLDLPPKTIGVDHSWTKASVVAECPHRSSSSRKRSYSEADLTCSTKCDLKAGATLSAFGDRRGNFGGSSLSAYDDHCWLDGDGQLDRRRDFATSPDNIENRCATSDASCSGECSGSSANHEPLLDWEEMIVDNCLLEAHHEHEGRAPCEVDVERQRPSEDAAPQQGAGIMNTIEGVAVVPVQKKYRGVVYNINTRKWEAHVWNPDKVHKRDAASRGNKRVKAGVQIYLGQYHTCEQAIGVHDMAAIKMGLIHDNRSTNAGSCSRPPYALNFPVEAYEIEVLEYREWSVRDYRWKLWKGGVGFSRGSSPMKGVSWKKKLNKFEARYSSNDCRVKREFHLGVFEDEETAGRHYDLAVLFFKGEDAITNFRPSLYSEVEVGEYGRELLLQRAK